MLCIGVMSALGLNKLLNSWRNDEYTVSQAHQHFQARYRNGRGLGSGRMKLHNVQVMRARSHGTIKSQTGHHCAILLYNDRDPSAQARRCGVDVLSDFEGWGGQALPSASGKARFAWKAQ